MVRWPVRQTKPEQFTCLSWQNPTFSICRNRREVTRRHEPEPSAECVDGAEDAQTIAAWTEYAATICSYAEGPDECAIGDS